MQANFTTYDCDSVLGRSRTATNRVRSLHTDRATLLRPRAIRAFQRAIARTGLDRTRLTKTRKDSCFAAPNLSFSIRFTAAMASKSLTWREKGIVFTV
jgi:hypothetical protein